MNRASDRPVLPAADSSATRPAAPLRIAAARATPYWLPASHFAAGLVFVTFAALLLPFVASDLAAGRFLLTRVVAATHLITLGWLTISIMGALCQLFPVVLGAPLRWVRLSALTLTLYVPGLLLFVCGLLTGQRLLTLPGAVLFSTALLLFLANAAGTLSRSNTRDFTWWTLAAAFGFLAATITFGVSLALNLYGGHLGGGRLTALMVHVHVALGGWVVMVIIAVARRLLPMFLLSHGAREWPLRVSAGAMFLGALLLSLFHRVMTAAFAIPAFALMAVSIVALALQVGSYVRKRHRPQLDAGLRLVLAGGMLVVLAMVIGIAALITGSAKLIAAYGVALVGGLALFVAGHYYKILPFLLWNHRFAPHVGKRALPKVSELYDARIATFAGAATTSGMLMLLVGVAMGYAPLAVLGAAVLLVGIATESIQLLRLLRMEVT